jgi:hypothetical protein
VTKETDFGCVGVRRMAEREGEFIEGVKNLLQLISFHGFHGFHYIYFFKIKNNGELIYYLKNKIILNCCCNTFPRHKDKTIHFVSRKTNIISIN